MILEFFFLCCLEFLYFIFRLEVFLGSLVFKLFILVRFFFFLNWKCSRILFFFVEDRFFGLVFVFFVWDFEDLFVVWEELLFFCLLKFGFVFLFVFEF